MSDRFTLRCSLRVGIDMELSSIGLFFFGKNPQQNFRFPDLIRVCDEIEDIVNDYILSQRRGSGDPPDSVYFASALRRMLLNPKEHQDRETRHLCHMYIDVAISEEVNRQKKVGTYQFA